MDGEGVQALPEDLRYCLAEGDGATPVPLLRSLPRLLLSLRGQAVLLFRIGQSARRISPLLGGMLRYLNHALTGADISPAASIGPGFRLAHPVGIVIGSECEIGRRCTITQGVTLGVAEGRSPKLGDFVYIGPGAKVLGGVEIGSYASVGANSVVLHDVAARRFVAGVPAKDRRESRHAPSSI